MNYGTEPWYKLFLRESTDDRVLPAFNRALRDFLLRLAKSRNDATILRKTDSPGKDIARAIGAHPKEVGLVAEYVESMLADGYLSHDGTRLWITNFVEAQNAKSPGAKRQDKWRDRPVKSPETASGNDISVSRDARETESDRLERRYRRGEERRDEERRGEETDARDARAGWLQRAVVRETEPGAAPHPRHDPLGEKLSYSQWSVSQQILDWLRLKRLPDAKVDKTLIELKDKVRGLHDVDFWDVKAIAFFEQAIARHATPPGAANHERAKAEGAYEPSAQVVDFMGPGLVKELR